jgi:hypothetical protein
MTRIVARASAVVAQTKVFAVFAPLFVAHPRGFVRRTQFIATVAQGFVTQRSSCTTSTRSCRPSKRCPQ